jgi:hypothetical protein
MKRECDSVMEGEGLKQGGVEVPPLDLVPDKAGPRRSVTRDVVVG